MQIRIELLQCRFGRILCVETVKDLEAGTELFVKYDITVDGDGLKSALKTALSLGQMFSGKSRKEFAKEVKPYLKVHIYRFLASLMEHCFCRLSFDTIVLALLLE